MHVQSVPQNLSHNTVQAWSHTVKHCRLPQCWLFLAWVFVEIRKDWSRWHIPVSAEEWFAAVSKCDSSAGWQFLEQATLGC